MKTFNTVITVLLLCFSISALAQTGDCSGAHILETKNEVNFNFTQESNQQADNLTSCVGADDVYDDDGALFSYWFTFKIEESGSLYFTLSQEAENYDIDFILFKSNSNENPCMDKQAIRCMFSGETIGQPSEVCTMETGLNLEENDLYENAGCGSGSNNFVKYIDAIAEEEYKLLVIDFSLTGSNTKLKLCGTAKLGPNDSSCLTLDAPDLETKKQFYVFPNPTTNHLFLTDNNNPKEINFPIKIIDQMGRVVYSKMDNSPLSFIDISDLKPNIYFLKILDESSNSPIKFVKQ